MNVRRGWTKLGSIVVLAVAVAAGTAPAASATVFVDDPTVTEGDSGTVDMTFTLTFDSLDAGSYETFDGTAMVVDDDYETTTGFYVAEILTPQGIVVPVNGDTLDEDDETLTLSVTYGGGEFTATGTGTILNDDGVVYEEPREEGGSGGGSQPGGNPGGGAGQVPDSDGDGVPNATDSCPMVAGTMPNGCPDLGGMLPPPDLGRTANVSVVDDDVFFKLPAGFASAGHADAAQKGQGFEPLIEPRQVPVGTLIDTNNGRVQVETARNLTGGTQFGKFSDGLFQVLQKRRTGAKTVLKLKGSSFSRCRVDAAGAPGTRASAARRRLSNRTVRRLSGNAKGSYRTRGRHSAATVRGTIWVTADRCDGTLTRVRRGRVSVRDFRRGRTVTVRTGKSYLAPAPG